jgi:hypothetical protein
VGSRAVLDIAVVKRKIPSPHRESNSRTPIVQPVMVQRSVSLQTEFHAINSSVSLVMAVKPKSKCAFRVTAILGLFRVTKLKKKYKVEGMGLVACYLAYPRSHGEMPVP